MCVLFCYRELSNVQIEDWDEVPSMPELTTLYVTCCIREPVKALSLTSCLTV